jgi:spoIIIJ-associated protein
MLEVLEETKGLFGRPGKLTVRATAGAPATSAPADEKPAKAARAPKGKPAKAVKAEEAAPAEAEAPAERPERPERPARGEKPERADVEATQDDADQLVEIVNRLITAGDLDVTCTCTQIQGRYVHLNLEGKDVGNIIGRRGEVLNSLQYLLNTIAARRLDNGVRITLEADHYRERRAATLTEMAQKLAAEVINRGEEAVLDALPAFERRVIHQALVDMEGVSTYSEGEEPNRRVVIAPAQ